MFEGRIYYCGHTEGDVIVKLAAVGAGKKAKRCGETAYNRCTGSCGVHPDQAGAGYVGPVADHPKYLCYAHLDFYE